MKVVKPSESYIKYKRAMQRFSMLDTIRLHEKCDILMQQVDSPLKTQSFDLWEGKAFNMVEVNKNKDSKIVVKKRLAPSPSFQKPKKNDQETMPQSSKNLNKGKNSIINLDLEFEIGA